MKKLPTVTIGIPTYYGGPSLVQAVQSIMASEYVGLFRLIVTVDGNPLNKRIRQQLKAMGTEIVENEERRGQTGRIKQLIELANSDLLILTQDDIKFTPRTLYEIVHYFETQPAITMVGTTVLPTKAVSFFESVIEVGVRLTHRIGEMWNAGDNYLFASGRCLAFRTDAVKRFFIPEEVINSDAYLYLENKRHGGVFRSLAAAIVFNKSPRTLREHTKQSKRFLYSKNELHHHFGKKIEHEYQIPLQLTLHAYLYELVHSPFITVAYSFLYVYINFLHIFSPSKEKRFWKTDLSTKRVY